MQVPHPQRIRGRILAVDDSAIVRLVLKASLEPLGYSVEVVDSGAAALQAAELESFDAVILDVDMPGLDGLAVGRALRCRSRSSDALIAMHTSVEEAVVRQGFTHYDAYLPKPCAPKELGEHLDRLLRSKHATGSTGLATAAG